MVRRTSFCPDLVSWGIGRTTVAAGVALLALSVKAREDRSAAVSTIGSRLPAESTAGNADWPVYLGNPGRSLYSPLDQINRSNVAELSVAWTYNTGEKGEYQSNNLIVEGVLYTATPSRRVIALDAKTGQEIWQWRAPTGNEGARRQRGLVLWQDPTGSEQRLFTAVGNFLYALDPRSGRLAKDFGQEGSIELGSGLDTDVVPKVGLNTPGVVYHDRLIIGGLGGPGAVRAFDVRTGERRWIFHLIPRPGEVGYDTWPKDAYRTATGVMPWCGQALDEERGIVYVATKTAEPAFYGASRPGDNLFANSLVALDAATGRRLWHHQLVHHDLLDRDLPCAPVLLTVTHSGKEIDVVAQGTKQGLLFVFDRVTGAPLWPVQERPVPISTLVGEHASPTQPFPTKPMPLTRQHYGESEASTISPAAHAATLERIRRSPNFGPFPAPALTESIMFPGFDGGMGWGGGAADPEGIYYVNVNEIPWILQMTDLSGQDHTTLRPGERDYVVNCAACHGIDRKGNPAGGFPALLGIKATRTRGQVLEIMARGIGRMPAFDGLPGEQRDAIADYLLDPEAARPSRTPDTDSNGHADLNATRYAFTGFRRWNDAEGYPAIKPPWGTLNAVDLNTGEIKWKVPLGEYRELTARGLAPTGTENYGGPVVTAGGLIFVAATADEKIRAFDKDSGAKLWEASLPFGGNATPSTYLLQGRQYVVISAGGGKSGRPAGGVIVCFALPDTR